MSGEPTSPFAFGGHPVAAPPAPAPLFSAQQIATATFFATPVAGALLTAWNLRRQQRRGPLIALGLGVGAIAVALWLDLVWSGAVWWLAVPAWTMAFGASAEVLFAAPLARAGKRSPWVAGAVGAATLVALTGAGAVATWMAPRAVPSFAEILFNWTGVGPHRVGWRDGASRDDALRVGDALARAGLTHHDARLSLTVARDGPRLVVNLRLPDAAPEALDGARALTRAVADHLEPAECVTGRIVSPGGAVLAEGTSCR